MALGPVYPGDEPRREVEADRPVILQYSVTGVPDEILSMTWDEWTAYRDSLSKVERAELRTAMTVTAHVTLGGLTIQVSSDGTVDLWDKTGGASGEIQIAHNRGAALVLRDTEGATAAKLLWPTAANALSFATSEGDRTVTTDFTLTGSDDGLWAGEQVYGMRTAFSPRSVVGGDLRLGDERLWGWIVKVGGAVGATITLAAYSVKCIKDGLWDAYDCTPGTIACFCNGCQDC